MRITMNQTRMGEAGSLLTAGQTYTVTDGFGAWLIGLGFAIDPDRYLPPQPNALAPIPAYTAEQLATLAAGGGLIPLATYVPSDANPPYQLWARDAFTLGSPLGCDLVSVQYAGSTGTTIEVLP